MLAVTGVGRNWCWPQLVLAVTWTLPLDPAAFFYLLPTPSHTLLRTTFDTALFFCKKKKSNVCSSQRAADAALKALCKDSSANQATMADAQAVVQKRSKAAAEAN